MLFLALGASALAHVGLDEPPPRYPSDGFSNNKACPCGSGSNNGTCSLPDRDDPNRSTTVTSYTAGETITIRAYEVVGHAGRWRVAFDPDGADLDDFNANILLDIADPPGSDGNVGQGDLWEFVVTLPSTPCDNCTLQLIQMMDGNTTDPVPDPTGRSTYYQCADIELIEGPGDTGPVPTDPTTPPGTTTTDPGPVDTGPGPVDPTVPSGDEDEAKGCGCASAPGSPWLAGGLVGLLAVARRRRS